MIELAITNIIYVSYRLAVSGPLVRLLLKWLPYYAAVFVMAQLSFVFDYFVFDNYFQNSLSTSLIDLVIANVLYVSRVVAAWWLIKQIWNTVNNYWVAVFIGAEITFIFDYFIFEGVLTR
jgi:cytochrome c oxidase subunit IV